MNMDTNNDIGTPQGANNLPSVLAVADGQTGIRNVLFRRWAFVALRAAVIGIIGWLARHNLGFVANLLGENVDAIVTGLCGAAVIGCHELDLMVALHPELLPVKCRIVWQYFHPVATVRPSALPTVAEIKPDAGKQGSIPLRLLLAVTLAIGFFVGIFAMGCSTVKADAKQIKQDITVDGRAIAQIVYVDGKAIVTLALADAQNLATNPVLQAAVAKDLVSVAPLLVK